MLIKRLMHCGFSETFEDRWWTSNGDCLKLPLIRSADVVPDQSIDGVSAPLCTNRSSSSSYNEQIAEFLARSYGLKEFLQLYIRQSSDSFGNHSFAPPKLDPDIKQECDSVPEITRHHNPVGIQEHPNYANTDTRSPKLEMTSSVDATKAPAGFALLFVAAEDLQSLGRVSLACKVCGARFKKPKGLARHTLDHFAGTRYSCGVCQRTFGLKADLNSHERTHRGKRSFKCDGCPYATKRLKSLMRHVRTRGCERYAMLKEMVFSLGKETLA